VGGNSAKRGDRAKRTGWREDIIGEIERGRGECEGFPD
jgi:hypothetical protein